MRERTALEVFLTFLKLGLTSFGGPIAHLGYFHQELVVRRRWMAEAAYADLVRFILGDTGVPYNWEYGDYAGKS